VNRRSLLRFLGLAPVAGPAAAKALADLDVPPVGPPLAVRSFGPDFPSLSSGLGRFHLGLGDLSVTLDRARRELADFLLPERRAERLRKTALERFDLDLAACGSMSLSAKYLIQRQRNFAADEAARHKRLLSQILSLEEAERAR
jgi:hypothetical protein